MNSADSEVRSQNLRQIKEDGKKGKNCCLVTSFNHFVTYFSEYLDVWKKLRTCDIQKTIYHSYMIYSVTKILSNTLLMLKLTNSVLFTVSYIIISIFFFECYNVPRREHENMCIKHKQWQYCLCVRHIFLCSLLCCTKVFEKKIVRVELMIYLQFLAKLTLVIRFLYIEIPTNIFFFCNSDFHQFVSQVFTIRRGD